MRRRPPAAAVLLVAATLALTGACGGARAGPADGAAVETARRVPVALVLERTSVASTDETLPFAIRLTNPERDSVRVDFTGDPLFPRDPRDRVPKPALWFTIERADRGSSTGSVHYPFATRDTVLAPGATMEVPVRHSLRAVGMGPGTYRMRAGLGAHASGWVRFTVTQ